MNFFKKGLDRLASAVASGGSGESSSRGGNSAAAADVAQPELTDLIPEVRFE